MYHPIKSLIQWFGIDLRSSNARAYDLLSVRYDSRGLYWVDTVGFRFGVPADETSHELLWEASMDSQHQAVS